MYLTIDILKKRSVFNTNELDAAFKRIPRNSFRKKVFYFIAKFIVFYKNIVSVPHDSKNIELFNGYSIEFLLNDLLKELNIKFSVILIVWAGDAIRKRRYVWVRDANEKIYFVKLGMGKDNIEKFKIESLNSTMFSRFCSGNKLKPVKSKSYISLSEVVFNISDCVFEIGAVSTYIPWSRLEPDLRRLRTETKGKNIFSPNDIDWVILNSDSILKDHLLVLNQFSGNEYSTCLSHGDLGSENVLVGDSIYLIDFECSLIDAPILLDPIASYLDTRNLNIKGSVWEVFSKSPELDVLLALCYLATNNFPPAIAALKMRKS